MTTEPEETPSLMGNILEGMLGVTLDDQKDGFKEAIGSVRSQTFSAPPTMTLYDYDVPSATISGALERVVH